MRRFLIDHGGASAAVSVWVMRTNFARVGGSVTITEDVQAAGKMTPANAGRIERGMGSPVMAEASRTILQALGVRHGSDGGQTRVRHRSDPGLAFRADEHGLGPIHIGEHLLEVLQLRKVVEDDVRMVGVTREKVLMVWLSRIERGAGLDPGDDRAREDARLHELIDIGLRNARLAGAVREDRRSVLRPDV